MVLRQWTSAIGGQALRVIGRRRFKGKGRLVHYWLQHRDEGYVGVRVVPGGGRIACDFSVPYEAMVWARQEEERELAALRTLLRPGDHFVDCGANVGLWSLTAAGIVGPTGSVTAFEPNPPAYQRLVRNIATSPHVGARITAVPTAVAARSGEVLFDMAAHHNVGHVVVRLCPGAIRISATTLDEHLAATPIHALKLDIEGGEYDALRGAQQLLRRQRPWIVSEFNTLITGRSRVGAWDVFIHLQQLGYTCRHLATDRGRVPGPRVTADDEFRGYVNLLFQPSESLT